MLSMACPVFDDKRIDIPLLPPPEQESLFAWLLKPLFFRQHRPLADIQQPTSRFAGNHSKQINSLSQSLKVTLAAHRETDVGASDQVLQGPGHEALARLGQRRDPRSDVHGNTAHVVVAKFDLTCVKPSANFDAERPDQGDQRQ